MSALGFLTGLSIGRELFGLFIGALAGLYYIGLFKEMIPSSVRFPSGTVYYKEVIGTREDMKMATATVRRDLNAFRKADQTFAMAVAGVFFDVPRTPCD